MARGGLTGVLRLQLSILLHLLLGLRSDDRQRAHQRDEAGSEEQQKDISLLAKVVLAHGKDPRLALAL